MKLPSTVLCVPEVLRLLGRGRAYPVRIARLSQKSRPDEFELRLAQIHERRRLAEEQAKDEEESLRIAFSRSRPSPGSGDVDVVFQKKRPGSSFAIDGEADLDEPFGYLTASCVYIPAGGARDIARRADELARGPPLPALEASILDAATRVAARSICTFTEDTVEAAWRADLEVWWPNTAMHENLFKAAPAETPLFMASKNLVDYIRQVSNGCPLMTAACAVGEIKRSSSVPLVALPQAFIAAGSSAQRLRALGLPLDRCVVPFVLHTGLLEQHGAAFLLKGNLPCCAFTSEVMDLLSPLGRRRAVGFRLAMREHAERTFASIPGVASNSIVPNVQSSGALDGTGYDGSSGGDTTVFSSRAYFLKTPALVHGAMDKSHVHTLLACELIQCARDAAAAAASAATAPVSGLPHRLAESHPALAPLLPLARLVKLPPGAEDGQAQVRQDGVSPLVMPRLGPAYADASTLPPPDHLRAVFFCGLVECVHWLHANAGVVHGDLVPANIMWQAAAAPEGGNDQLLLRIVDLDAALPVGTPIPATARDITAKNGFKHVYRELGRGSGGSDRGGVGGWVGGCRVRSDPHSNVSPHPQTPATLLPEQSRPLRSIGGS